ncbi:MAG: hypothetical protein V2A73_21565, partial [Pseudomonadota bacterium]
PACANREVTLTGCDIGGPIKTNAEGSIATFVVTACSDTACEDSLVCAAAVTDEHGLTTSVQQQVNVDTVAEPCDLTVTPTPLDVAGFFPAVLNSSMDIDPEALFQATLTVSTTPGMQVEVMVGVEPQGSSVADGAGLASFAVDLADGSQTLKTTCIDLASNSSQAEVVVLVDTIEPTCSITTPTEGQVLIPADDVDTGDADTDFEVRVDVGGGDVDGELVAIRVGETDLSATVQTGEAVATASLTDPAPAIAVSATVHDHALNSCEDAISIRHETVGCPIAFISPSAAVTNDTDLVADGLQTSVAVQVGAACAGRTVTLASCDIAADPLTVVATSGDPPLATFTTTICADAVCEAVRDSCTASVANEFGIVTTNVAAIRADTVVPGVPADLAAAPRSRNTVRLAWTAPADNGNPVQDCVVRTSSTEIADESAWNAATTYATVPGVAPGTEQTLDVTPLPFGKQGSRFFAIRCRDAASNSGALASAGPAAPGFIAGPTFGPATIDGANMNKARFGLTSVSLDINLDGFSDFAVGAPILDTDSNGSQNGAVYVYLGGATGISSTPDFVVSGSKTTHQQFGRTIAAIDWNGDSHDDLAIGAPRDQSNLGGVFIFYSDAITWEKPTETSYSTEVAASVSITPDGIDPLFLGSYFGYSLAVVDYDGDGRDDIAIGSPYMESTRGGTVVVFGGSNASSIAVPSGLAAANATAFLLRFSSAPPMIAFGFTLVGLNDLGDADPTGFPHDDILVLGFPDNVSPAVGNDPIESWDVAYVYYGRPRPAGNWTVFDNLAAEELLVAEPETLPDKANAFGYRAASISDQDADGKREIVITASDYGAKAGRVYIVPGGTSVVGTQERKDVGSSSLFIVEGSAGSDLGRNYLPLPGKTGGDIDGDGTDDMFVGSAAAAPARAYYCAFLGDSNHAGLIPMASCDAYARMPGNLSAIDSASWAGDLNGDGNPDLVVGYAMFFQTAETGLVQILY